jgi:type VI protein secretion system component VasK
MLFGRRTKFAIIVLASQILLIALAIVMLLQMIFIARNGVVQFEEGNRVILIIEIILTGLIIAFSASVFVIQIRRLEEKRNSDYRDAENKSGRR